MDFTASDIAIMAKTPLFVGLDEETVRNAVCDAPVREYKAGECLFREGTELCGLWILLEGRARVSKNASGAQVLMSILVPGATMGASCLFVDGARTVTHVEAVTACRTAAFPDEKVRQLMRDNFQIAQNYMRYLTGRIRFLTGRIESIGSPGASGKLWNYLVSSAHEGAVDLSIGYTALAAALCVSRASLYRALDELEQRGAIERSGHTIYIKENLTEEI